MLQTENSLNITVVTETYLPEVNGVAMTLGQLVSGLVKQGHHVSLMRPKLTPDELSCDTEGFSEYLLPSIPLPFYKEVRLGLPSRRSIKQIWQKQKPDVIYVATEGPLGYSAIRIANKFSIPIVSGFHTNFHSYGQYYKLKWLAPTALLYLRHTHNKTQTTLVPTRTMANQLLSHGFYNVKVMQRGVDTALFSPTKRSSTLRKSWKVKGDELVITYVGRIAAEKNIAEIVSTVKQLQLEYPIKFVLVGTGPLEKTLAADNPDFIFCGMQKGESLAAHYASGDLFIFTSHTETYGNVVPEALASGLAVIAYDEAAAHEHITDKVNGMLISHRGGPQELLQQAKLICQDVLLREQVRKNASQYTQKLTWKNIVKEFETYLRQVIINHANTEHMGIIDDSHMEKEPLL